MHTSSPASSTKTDDMVSTPVSVTKNLSVGKTPPPCVVHEMVGVGKSRGVEQVREAMEPETMVVLGPMDAARGGPVKGGGEEGVS
jgi:hypothetical protein